MTITSREVKIAQERDRAKSILRQEQAAFLQLLQTLRPHLARVPSAFEPKKGTRIWGPDEREELLRCIDEKIAKLESLGL